MGTFTKELPESAEPVTEAEVRTAFDYYTVVLATGAGGRQKLIAESSDYLGSHRQRSETKRAADRPDRRETAQPLRRPRH
jgi:hypothetical protein